ncbi:MAG: DUF190 domain-containing protein [Bryobacterales bacterium]|jgi:hypothetical protein|nr:DUF190 domain-containing protein [Bryobacterales bacterium]
MTTQVKMLVLFFDEEDSYGDPRIPLYEAVIRVLIEREVQGATVLRGRVGFGAAGRLREAGLFGVSPDRPITLLCVDTEAKLRGVWPAIAPMVREGMAVMLDAELMPPAGAATEIAAGGDPR